MDNSVQIKDKGHFERRVGISDGEIVILDGNLNEGYHGHVRSWDEIASSPYMNDIKKALLDNNLVDKTGKIL